MRGFKPIRLLWHALHRHVPPLGSGYTAYRAVRCNTGVLRRDPFRVEPGVEGVTSELVGDESASHRSSVLLSKLGGFSFFWKGGEEQMLGHGREGKVYSCLDAK